MGGAHEAHLKHVLGLIGEKTFDAGPSTLSCDTALSCFEDTSHEVKLLKAKAGMTLREKEMHTNFSF